MRFFVAVFWRDGAVEDADTFQVLAKNAMEAESKASSLWKKRFASKWPDCKVVGVTAYKSNRKGLTAKDG